MNKLLTAMLVSATAMALGTSVLAADQDTQSRDNQTQAQPNATKGKPGQADAQGGSDRMKDHSAAGANQSGQDAAAAKDPSKSPTQSQTNREDARSSARNNQNAQKSMTDPEYTAQLKKCDSKHGSRKQKCIDAVKKNAGEM